MKGTGRIILGIFGVCALAIVYVHLQVSTFLASYEIDHTSHRISSAHEQLQKLKFEMEQFKAPRLLEGRLKQYEMNLAIPQMVYRVPKSFEEIQNNQNVGLPAAKGMGASRFLKQALSGWIQVAHAKNETSES